MEYFCMYMYFLYCIHTWSVMYDMYTGTIDTLCKTGMITILYVADICFYIVYVHVYTFTWMSNNLYKDTCRKWYYFCMNNLGHYKSGKASDDFINIDKWDVFIRGKIH